MVSSLAGGSLAQAPAECHPANNTLGSCQCDETFFIAENCTKVSQPTSALCSVQY